jgi:PAS domain-containing protein
MSQTAQQGASEVSARREDPTIPMPSSGAFSSGMLTLEQAPAALGLATLAGDLFFLNARAQQLFGIAPGGPLGGRNLADLCTEAGQLAVLEAVARDGRERNLTVYRDAGAAPAARLLLRLSRVAGYGGIPTWIAFVAVERDDATDNDAPLTEAESMSILRRLASAAAWKMRIDDHEQWTNNTMQWGAGVHPLLNLKFGGSRLSARSFLDFVAREDREAIRVAMARALQSGMRFEAVYRLNPRNGAAKVVLSRAVVAADEENSGVATMFGSVHDITSALGGEMRPYEKAAILDTLATSLEAPVYAVDRDLRYTYFNPFFALTMRHVYGTDAVVGEKAYESIPDEGRRRVVLAHLRRALAGARVVEEIRITLDDAVPRRFDLTYAPVKSGAAPGGGVAVFGVRNPNPASVR